MPTFDEKPRNFTDMTQSFQYDMPISISLTCVSDANPEAIL